MIRNKLSPSNGHVEQSIRAFILVDLTDLELHARRLTVNSITGADDLIP